VILETTPNILAVCRLESDSTIPEWALRSPFFSITKTKDELSIVCSQSDVPVDVKAERDWRRLKVQGPLDFGLTGVLASLANPLAQARISIFAVSTFDTDYLLVKQCDFDHAIRVLSMAGHEVQCV
jgi:uncharacterized protein